jgi:hypothetical protein
MYIGFLLSEPKQTTCRRLGKVISILHDNVNRFLNRELYSERNLYQEASSSLNLKGGTLSVNDSVQRDLFKDMIVSFIGAFMPNMDH